MTPRICSQSPFIADLISFNLSLCRSNKTYPKWPYNPHTYFSFGCTNIFLLGVISYLDVIQILSKYELSYSVMSTNTIIIWSTFKCLLWCPKKCFQNRYKSFTLVSMLWLLSNTHAIFSKVQDALPKKNLYECSTHWWSITDAIQFFLAKRIYFT